MKRRTFLPLLGSTALGGIAGCVGGRFASGTDDEWEPEIRGDEPELAPDTQTTITIDARPIQTLEVKPEGQTGIHDDFPEGPVELDYSDVTIEPHPNGSLDSIPPRWSWWESQTDVSVELLVHVAPDADAGEYPYSVDITEGGDVPESGEEESAIFSITVPSQSTADSNDATTTPILPHR